MPLPPSDTRGPAGMQCTLRGGAGVRRGAAVSRGQGASGGGRRRGVARLRPARACGALCAPRRARHRRGSLRRSRRGVWRLGEAQGLRSGRQRAASTSIGALKCGRGRRFVRPAKRAAGASWSQRRARAARGARGRGAAARRNAGSCSVIGSWPERVQLARTLTASRRARCDAPGARAAAQERARGCCAAVRYRRDRLALISVSAVGP